jgi:hypothetical protein
LSAESVKYFVLDEFLDLVFPDEFRALGSPNGFQLRATGLGDPLRIAGKIASLFYFRVPGVET